MENVCELVETGVLLVRVWVWHLEMFCYFIFIFIDNFSDG